MCGKNDDLGSSRERFSSFHNLKKKKNVELQAVTTVGSAIGKIQSASHISNNVWMDWGVFIVFNLRQINLTLDSILKSTRVKFSTINI